MKTILVAKNSMIDTLSKAITLLGEEPTTIYLGPGIYYEKIKITKSNLKIIGTSPRECIIIYDDFAKKIHEDGLEYNTFRTYTMMIIGSNIELLNLQIVNSSGFGPSIGQAVALHLLGHNIKIDNCLMKAYQDTLFLGPLPEDLRKRYENFLPDDERIDVCPCEIMIDNSIIEGNVDFIFGCADATFYRSKIISNGNGYVAAPATPKDQFFGLTFIDCSFTSSVPDSASYLARPWRDYGKAIFINCHYDNHILETGFNKWNDSNRDQTCRFGEYKCSYLDNKEYIRVPFAKELTDDEVKIYLQKIK